MFVFCVNLVYRLMAYNLVQNMLQLTQVMQRLEDGCTPEAYELVEVPLLDCRGLVWTLYLDRLIDHHDVYLTELRVPEGFLGLSFVLPASPTSTLSDADSVEDEFTYSENGFD